MKYYYFLTRSSSIYVPFFLLILFGLYIQGFKGKCEGKDFIDDFSSISKIENANKQHDDYQLFDFDSCTYIVLENQRGAEEMFPALRFLD
ncbi:MAG: hypothetical protein LAT68_05875 [Cyclobacteriaceae bacterium]|nr:hypothetical protein [Cyclobacteriaceae bacterium]MCH8515840.1 hypothetical protein [Cyclobacteriaceae bacterium]